MKKTLIGLVAVVLIAVAAAYGWRWHLISELRKPILAELNDPDSALFRDESYGGKWFGRPVLCGEINSKNKMGGYAGYVTFYSAPATDSQVKAMHEIETDRPSAEWISKVCNDFRYPKP